MPETTRGYGEGQPTDLRVQAIARRICRERCAYMGEPACWAVGGEWPNPNCDDPGCQAFAEVAVDAMEQVE